MMTLTSKIEAKVEQFYPLFAGLIAGVLCAAFGKDAFFYAVVNRWKVEVLYSSVFDLMAVATAFLFTFYTFFVTTDRGFIGRMKTTTTYKLLMRYTLSAIVLGAIVILLSIPMMLIVPAPIIFDGRLVAVSVWTFFAVWAIASFVRAAHLFTVVATEHT